MTIGTPTQLQAATSTMLSVSVAGVDLSVAEEMKVLGVVLDRRHSRGNYMQLSLPQSIWRLSSEHCITIYKSFFRQRDGLTPSHYWNWHWLTVHHRIDYKLAILSYKMCTTSTPIHPNRHIRAQKTTHDLRSSSMPLLLKPTTRTHFADRAFCCTVPSVWNSLNSDTVAVFKI